LCTDRNGATWSLRSSFGAAKEIAFGYNADETPLLVD
jgi:hypothetical protein